MPVTVVIACPVSLSVSWHQLLLCSRITKSGPQPQDHPRDRKNHVRLFARWLSMSSPSSRLLTAHLWHPLRQSSDEPDRVTSANFLVRFDVIRHATDGSDATFVQGLYSRKVVRPMLHVRPTLESTPPVFVQLPQKRSSSIVTPKIFEASYLRNRAR